MDGITLLCEARAAGLTLTLNGERLRIRGPRKADPVARQLLAHKTVIVEALQDHLPLEWHLRWDELAAVIEYEKKIPRERAEAAALANIVEQIRRGN